MEYLLAIREGIKRQQPFTYLFSIYITEPMAAGQSAAGKEDGIDKETTGTV